MQRDIFLVIVALCLVAGYVLAEPAAQAQRKQIRNESVRVAWNSSQEVFVASGAESGVFARVEFDAAVKSCQVAEWSHAEMGKGEMLEAQLADGGVGRIIVLPGQPFLFLQKSMPGDKGSVRVVHDTRPFSLNLDLPEKAADLKALGTAGLTAPDKHPGSYVFLAIASSQTRHGVVSGWLSHDRGSGVVFSSVEGDAVSLQPQIDYGKLRIPADGQTDSEIFAVGLFDDARLGLEAYADAVVKYYHIRLHPIMTGYCTWYSNPNGGASDAIHLAELTEAAAKQLKPYGFDFVQIDDKWQDGKQRNGPAKLFFQVRPDGPYPDGMKKSADHIAAQGLVPGIWFMPFAGDREDPFFMKHLDWFVKKEDGTPYWVRWGGTSLDMTNPDAREYVRSFVKRIAHEWNYKYFKMDGMWVGSATNLTYVNNGYVKDDIGEAVFLNPEKTNIEAYRDGLKMVREAAGDDVFILGCCVSQNMRSFGGAFGMVDAMRIGPDNGANWNSLQRGPWHGTNRYFLHGRVWYNDPDPIYLRKSLPLSQSQLICSWVTLAGQMNVFSEWLPGLPEERLDLLRRTMPNHGLKPRPVDLFENELSKIWLLTDERQAVRRDVVGLFNWKEKEADAIDCDVAYIGLPEAKSYVGFDYWANRFVPPFSGSLKMAVPPASSRVIAIRPAADHPLLISTSRHITQGIVDVTEELWDAQTNTLSGKSKVVEGDPYELRIIVPTGEKSFKIAEELVSAAGKILSNQNGPMIRVLIEGAKTGTIEWKVRFEKASVEAPEAKPIRDLKSIVTDGGVALNWDCGDVTLFRVKRSDGRVVETTVANFTDMDVKHGAKYAYSVQSVGWTGDLSAAMTVTVVMPEEMVMPGTPPKPDISITTLQPVSANIGYGKMMQNKSCDNNPLRLGGKTYKDGLGLHAPCELVFNIPKGAGRFVAVAGLDDEKKTDERSSIIAQVFGDVGEMGEAPVLLATSPVLSNKTVRVWNFDAELSTRFRTVRLVFTDAGDGIASDHADWVDAGFVTGEK